MKLYLKTSQTMKMAITLLLALFVGADAFAQGSYKIKGLVTDYESGEPVIGATVGLKGERATLFTDVNGEFIISCPNTEATVEIRSVGYEPVFADISSTKLNVIRMRQSADVLNEVVVVGYGTTTRKDLTGSVAKVDVEDMQKAPVSNFEEALAGRVAGVVSSSSDGQPGSDLNIVIRGNNSVTQSNTPLYVVDGFPLETSVGNVLNPEEIESMEILKDASATAIYGARGANGVILITTKKGKIGRPVVSYNLYMGV